jgi:DNA sulfur modification protein DndD
MRFEKLEFENYRQYRNESIDLISSTQAKHFTIIEGANGAGKTNILNAITWCLYGEEMDLGNRNVGKPIVNEVAFEEANDNGIICVKIKITAKDEENTTFIFERGIRYQKENGKLKQTNYYPEVGHYDKTFFRIFKIVYKDPMIVPDPEDTIRRIFPQRICKYFFFNGEKLDDYFRSGSNERIKEEVFNISQLELFDTVREHLTKCRDSFNKDIKNVSPDLVRKKLELDEAGKILQEKKERLNILQEEKKKADELLKRYDSDLRTASSYEIRKLQEDREALEIELQALENEKKESEQERIEFLINSAPVIYGFEAISGAIKIIEKKIDSGAIPPNFRRRFIEGLLLKGHCICGGDISKENLKARSKVEEYLKECDSMEDHIKEIIEDNNRLKDLIQKLDGFTEKQVKYSKHVNEVDKRIEEKSIKVKKLGDQLKNSNIDEIEKKERAREIANSKRDEIIGDICILKGEIESLKSRMVILEEEYKKEVGKIKKHNKLKQTLLFCEDVLMGAGTIKDEIMEEIRAQIQKETKKQFFELIWKKKSFKDLKISADYNISVLDNFERESIGTLSAGERQVLALSFMSALNIVSGFDSPLVIDTPLGRISREPKDNIASNLPGYLKDKQVILLVTEEEYSDSVRNKLKHVVNNEYKIKFIESKTGNEAKVVKYGE